MTYLLAHLSGQGSSWAYMVLPFLAFSFSFFASWVKYMSSNLAKGNFSPRILTLSKLETVRSDMGVSQSSWIPAVSFCLPLSTYCLFLTAYPVNYRLLGAETTASRRLLKEPSCVTQIAI